MSCLLITYILNDRKLNSETVPYVINGILAGLVAITGICDNMEPWAAFVFAGIGGFIYILLSKIWSKLGVDDPLDASPLHGGVGLFGAIIVGLMDVDTGGFYGHGGK